MTMNRARAGYQTALGDGQDSSSSSSSGELGLGYSSKECDLTEPLEQDLGSNEEGSSGNMYSDDGDDEDSDEYDW